ncbi:MAG: hypothetical protein ABS45_01525 [Comamonas sp. SCN 65-56]|uniref:Btc22 family type III secretion system chaperone n=1 Tax=Comamonas sp. SCN 65-56 TaxID=1660095 RepID=UPI00086D5932|nr:hypothetical protein [Comamonas sp. SCN 65-56]ODS93676.1 MAG: hypothetical protein ABS45_01525 [Comamonas sp. SCN 65-56]
MASRNTPDEIMAQAQNLIAQAQRELDQTDDVYRRQGLDPQKARQVLQAQSTADVHAQAQAAFQEDLAAIEREVQEEAARLSFDAARTGGQSAGGSRPPRSMV